MSRFYTDPSRENDPWALPNAEAFYAKTGELTDDDGEPLPAGWYWWVCFPGCMPDSDPFGPFDTKEEAINDARKTCED